MRQETKQVADAGQATWGKYVWSKAAGSFKLSFTIWILLSS
ncbi:hypothetical protein VCR14J2_410525 [Vibrio coralliirubri]|nr:hypothetical protein VCR14J2_410525 [Vibrio coralliirubri]